MSRPDPNHPGIKRLRDILEDANLKGDAVTADQALRGIDLLTDILRGPNPRKAAA